MNILFQIYVRYGVAPFSEAARVSDTALLAYFLHRRLTKSKHPERYRARGAFEDLIDKYMHVPRATRRRHGWMILGVSGRWDCLTYYGCASPSCPELAELLRIRERRVRGQRDAAIEERLYDWGAKSKMCARYVVFVASLRDAELIPLVSAAVGLSRTAVRRARSVAVSSS